MVGHGMVAKLLRRNIAFSIVSSQIHESYYRVEIFGYGLYRLYCFRVSSLTVEGGRNLFMCI